jgi:sugar phosphate isomerase/epimerase
MHPRVLVSTTSHKQEPLLPTLEVFARLGLCDIDLNLHHILEGDVGVDDVGRAARACGLRIRVASGGWCDFFDGPPRIEDTFRSVDRQVDIARTLDAGHLRLFFGRLARDRCTPDRVAAIRENLARLSDRFPDMIFMFENHDGASLDPAICREVILGVDRPNIGLNFDPINFERAGVNSLDAARVLGPLIGHVHLKGIEGGELCEFGAGDVDLTPVLECLAAQGYGGGFTVEYEGRADGTLRLYQGVQRARAALRECA